MMSRANNMEKKIKNKKQKTKNINKGLRYEATTF